MREVTDNQIREQIADLALEYADSTYGNEANRLMVIRFFEGLSKAGIMSDKSKKHYKFKR